MKLCSSEVYINSTNNGTEDHMVKASEMETNQSTIKYCNYVV